MTTNHEVGSSNLPGRAIKTSNSIMSDQAILSVEDVTLWQAQELEDKSQNLNFAISEGKVTVVYGLSGSGKTSNPSPNDISCQ